MSAQATTAAAVSKKYIAVTDAELKTAGLIVWWRLSGGLNLAALTKEWLESELDIDLLPDQPTRATALRRALADLKQSDRLLRGAPAGGFVLKQEVADLEDNDNDYRTLLKAHLDEDENLVVEGPDSHLFEEQIRAGFRQYKGDLTQADVSPWLTWLMEKIHAVALRDTGGIYFVPSWAMGDWNAIVASVRSVSKHDIFGVPALRTTEAVKAIEDAIAQEALEAARVIEEEVAVPDIGEKALQNRVEKTNAVEAKLAQYEELLGGRMEALHEKLDLLRARCTEAIVRAQAAKAAEEAARAS